MRSTRTTRCREVHRGHTRARDVFAEFARFGVPCSFVSVVVCVSPSKICVYPGREQEGTGTGTGTMGLAVASAADLCTRPGTRRGTRPRGQPRRGERRAAPPRQESYLSKAGAEGLLRVEPRCGTHMYQDGAPPPSFSPLSPNHPPFVLNSRSAPPLTDADAAGTPAGGIAEVTGVARTTGRMDSS